MTAFDPHPDITPIINSVANDFGRRGHTWGADHDDFRQELLLWIFEHPKKVEAWLEEEKGAGALRRALENECRDYLMDIKAQAEGYERRDLYFYSVGELKILLDSVFDPEKWLEPPMSDGRSTKAPAEGNNWVVTLADVAGAFRKLNKSDQQIIEDFHRWGYHNNELAKMSGVSEAVMSYRHGAAVKRLQRHLGGPPPSPTRTSETDPAWRNRHAITNATAMALTSENYDEG